jgi:hypothetical protein
MPITHKQIRGFALPNGTVISKTFDITAGGEINIDESIAGPATNAQVALTLDVSQVRSLFISADGALTLKTNSSGSPTNTIALAAGVPFIWASGDAALRDTSGTAMEDVTTLYVTNAGSTAVVLQLRALHDPTV